MIDKVQYGDYNRFLVSTGLVLIAIGLLLPYFYMKETFDLLIKSDEIKTLTPIAQKIITARQGYAQKLVSVVPPASLISAILGIVLLIFGGMKWRKRQNIEDEKVLLDSKKTVAESNKLEAETSIILKGAEKIPQNIVIENKAREIERIEPNLSTSEKSLSVYNYLFIETLIAEKFKHEYSDEFNIHTNYRVNNFEFDIILEAINNNTQAINLRKDKIVEIKYARRIDKRYVRDTLIRMGEMIKAYPKAITNPIILFVSAEKDVRFDRSELLSQIISEWSEKTISKWNIKFIDVEDLPTLELKEILDA